MAEVLAGCTQDLPATHPFAAPGCDVMELTRIVHNQFVYQFRQDEIVRERRRREAWHTGSRTPLPKRLSARARKGLVRGTHTRDLTGAVVESDPGASKAVIGMLGVVWDRVAYDFQAGVRGYFGLRDTWFALGRVGPEPGLPTYHRGRYRKISYRASLVRLSSDGTRLSFPKGKSPAAVNLPDLLVPTYVRAALGSGQARLVEVTLLPRRDGGVRVQWSIAETGRRGCAFPCAPATLAEALELGPVAAVDPGVGNLLACTITDLRTPEPALSNPAASNAALANPAPLNSPSSAPAPALPSPLALPGPLLVRGATLDDECHAAGLRVDRCKSQLPFLRGGTRGSATDSTTDTATVEITTKTTPPDTPLRKKTSGRRQRRSSHKLGARRDKHADRTHHLVHAAAQLILRHIQAAGCRALVVGWNEGIKQELQMGRVQNRRFGAIPYDALRGALRAGCLRLGILYLEVEESYTSKTSFQDGELPEKQMSYAGRRVTRGLFRTGTGVRVNADVNASLQILVRALVREGCTGALAGLTPSRREEIIRASLNPRSVAISRGAGVTAPRVQAPRAPGAGTPVVGPAPRRYVRTTPAPAPTLTLA